MVCLRQKVFSQQDYNILPIDYLKILQEIGHMHFSLQDLYKYCNLLPSKQSREQNVTTFRWKVLMFWHFPFVSHWQMEKCCISLAKMESGLTELNWGWLQFMDQKRPCWAFWNINFRKYSTGYLDNGKHSSAITAP